MNYRTMLGFIVAAALLAQSCQSDPNPKRAQIDLQVGSTTYRTELCASSSDRELGLMYREAIADDEAMLFIFESDEHLSFWMANTKVPLSIAYIDYQGVIKEIHDMAPMDRRSIVADNAVRFALEVAQGSFARRGVKVGDRITLPTTLPRPDPNR